MANPKVSRVALRLIIGCIVLAILPAIAYGRRYYGFDTDGLPGTGSPYDPPGGLPGGVIGGPGADPFQRYIIFHNQLPITVYPVITARESENCGPIARARRIHVNQDAKGKGVPRGGTVKVFLPKDPHCWYNAVRVLVFNVDLEAFETLLNEKQRTVPDNMVYVPALCANDACWTGHATDEYPADAPAQLIEYTIDSIDPTNGKRFPDANNPAGIPMVDLDLSYVDEVFLPVTMALDDGGATRYMGTALGYDQFNKRTEAFLAVMQQGVPIWSQYAAFSPINWPNNVFSHLSPGRTNRIEGGYNFVHNVFKEAQSALYTPTSTGPKACSATPACSDLAGNCCPADNGQFLSCCNVQPYIIDNTLKVNGKASNPSVTAYVARWKQWITGDPCTDLSKITKWPSDLPAFDKPEFCGRFRDTARFVWAEFAKHPNCTPLSGFEQDLCTLDGILGFLSGDSTDGRLNQSVQAVQRSVPWGDPAQKQKQYQNDKFILFWAPYDSPFNLNMYTRLVHNKAEGLDAPGAYSFSIDDRFGNFQNRASGFIINLGGDEALPNQEPFDFYQQYRVSWGPGWDHADVCGRRVLIPGRLGGNAPLSLWRDGQRFPSCRIFLYKDANETQHAAFRVGEKAKTVTDTYTGLKQQIRELTNFDPDWCKTKSSPDLVAAGICNQIHLSITAGGEEAYVSVSDAEKPLVNVNYP